MDCATAPREREQASSLRRWLPVQQLWLAQVGSEEGETSIRLYMLSWAYMLCPVALSPERAVVAADGYPTLPRIP